jgi:hypothetical protein
MFHTCHVLLVFLVSWSRFKIKLALVLVLVGKSCKLGCFHARYNKGNIIVPFHIPCAINPMGSSSRFKMIKHSKKPFESFTKHDQKKKPLLWKILLANTTVNLNIVHPKLFMFGIWKGQMGPCISSWDER